MLDQPSEVHPVVEFPFDVAAARKSEPLSLSFALRKFTDRDGFPTKRAVDIRNHT
jgi:hypothetical protein